MRWDEWRTALVVGLMLALFAAWMFATVMIGGGTNGN